ncbi:hypothetical protein SAMN05421856_103344 [Chryseobacterium taichungense]|uniref:Outer membrane protein beta-barrel domain-containing protein n=1 Tax=Chryseobacterium taichungense TaxID=295069 RepID=A0A1H7YHQ2_9FLAO|nr:hypothetical protein [Chryseobacterium taichungense]SEM45766.1 hypothetical protein SAMN05421856_103344 [Chryseobacterium taichungense]
MKNLKKYGLLVLAFITSSVYVHAQETAEHHSIKGKIGISAVMGHAFIKTKIENENEINSAAAFGLNANYWLSDRWAVGIHSDMVFENFIIEEKNTNGERSFIEREYPLSVNLVTTYKPIPSLGVMAGFGQEFSRKKDLTMFVVGTEYMFELPHHLELGVSVMYEAKRHAYDTFVVGLGITKLINLKKHHS